MFFYHRKKSHPDIGCYVCHVVVMLFLLLAALTALSGAIMAHYYDVLRGLLFGSTAAPLWVLAFAVSASLWMYALKCCMGKCEACGTNGKK